MEILLSELFASGRIVELILAVLVIEWLLMSFIYFYKGKGIAPLHFLIHALPGVFIFLALRAALHEQGWQMIGLFLGLSFIAHLADLILLARRKKNSAEALF